MLILLSFTFAMAGKKTTRLFFDDESNFSKATFSHCNYSLKVEIYRKIFSVKSVQKHTYIYKDISSYFGQAKYLKTLLYTEYNRQERFQCTQP